MKRSEIIALLQQQGRLPTLSKQAAREGEFYSETLPMSTEAMATDIYTRPELGKLAQQSMQRGIPSVAQDIGSYMSKPRTNIPKATGEIAYRTAGKEGVQAMTEEFKKRKPEDWKEEGRQIVEEGGTGTWDKVLKGGKTLLTEAGTALATPGALTRHGIMALNDPNVKFNPYAVLAGSQNVPGSDAGKYREWTENAPGIIPAIHKNVGKAGEVVGGVVGTLPVAGYQKLQGKDVDFGEAWKDAAKWGGDVAVDITSDPTNLISFGGGTAAKNATAQGAKMAALSGLKGEAAKQAAKKFALRATDLQGGLGAGRRAMEFAKGKGITPEAFEKVAGKGGEFLGERGLNIAGMQIGNMEGKGLMSKAREKLADAAGIDIWKLNAQDRKAFLQSVSKAGSQAEAVTEKKIKERFLGKTAEEQAALLADKDKMKAFTEGFFQGKPRTPESALKLARQEGREQGLKGKELKEFAAANTSKYAEDPGLLFRVRNKRAEQLGTQAERLAKEGMLTPEQAEIISKQAKERLGKSKPLLNIENELAKKVLAGGKAIHKGAVDIAREGMMASPGYHLQNIKDDVLLGFMSGGESLRGWNVARKLGRAADDAAILTDDLGRKISKKSFLDDAYAEGVIGGPDRLLDGQALSESSVRGALSKEFGGKVADRNIGETWGKVANLGLSIPGKKLASKWDDTHRLALFAEYRAQGLNPKAAAMKVNDIAFNYKDPGEFPGLLKVAKAFNPFIGWGYRAATRVPKAALANPIRAKIAPTAMRNLSGEAKYEQDKVPEYLRKSTIAQLPDSAKAIVNKGLGIIGAEKIGEGEGLKMTTRDPTTGALGVAGDFFSERNAMGGPVPRLIKPLLPESFGGGKDAFGRDTSVGLEAAKMLGGRYFPMAADVAAAYGGFNDPFVAKQRESTTPKRDAALRAARMLTGETLIPTSPGVEAKELMYNKEQEKRLKKLGSTKGTMKRAEIVRILREQGKL